jgi:tRNA (mo5U34)-methyltransferase
MNLKDMYERVPPFQEKIAAVKSKIRTIPWYNYDSFANFQFMKEHFKGAGQEAFAGIETGKRIVDIGAADGDTSFFLESLGGDVTIIDNPSTNANDCRAILEMRAAIHSKAKVIMSDLDWASLANTT